MPKIKRGDIVEVVWEDAHSGDSWTPEEQMMAFHNSPYLVTQIGILFRHDKRGIMLTMGGDEKGYFTNHMFIPKGMIRKVRKIK